jgi:hypothetical protein
VVGGVPPATADRPREVTIAGVLLLLLPLVSVVSLVSALIAVSVAQDNAARIAGELANEFAGELGEGLVDTEAMVDSMLSALWLQLGLTSVVRLIQAIGFGVLAFFVLRGSPAGRIGVYVLAALVTVGAVCLGALDGVRQGVRSSFDRVASDAGIAVAYETDLLPGWYRPVNYATIAVSVAMILAVVWLLTRPAAHAYFRRGTSDPGAPPPVTAAPPPTPPFPRPPSVPPARPAAEVRLPAAPGPAPVSSLSRSIEDLFSPGSLAPARSDPPEPDRPEPDRPEVRCDPWAAALGNATLLGLGYLLLRRWRATAGTLVTTGVLVLIVSAADHQPGWTWRAILFGWWIATTAHGWRLAGGRWAPAPLVIRGQTRPVRRQRLVAAATAAAVLAALVGLTIDSRRVEAAAVDGHRAGDCDRAIAGFDRIGGRHRLVDPLVTARAELHAQACELLSDAQRRAEHYPADAADGLADYLAHPAAVWEGAAGRRAELLVTVATGKLDRALLGDLGALTEAVDNLVTVLDEAPANRDQVAGTLASYQTGLHTADPCDARSNLNWFSTREFPHPELTQTKQAIEPRTPQVLVDCGNELLATDAEEALDTFQQVLVGYPEHPLAAEAAERVEVTEDLIVRQELSRVLGGWPGEERSSAGYCDEPVGYSKASRYTGPGPHRMVVIAHHQIRSAVESWQATDFTDAVLVLCGDEPAPGSVLGSCDYLDESGERPRPFTVPLHALSYHLRVFELRTGDQIGETTVEFGGDCPPSLYREPDGSIPDEAMPWYSDEDTIRARVRQWVFP